MAHDCTILANRSNFWKWESLTIGIFDWLQADPRPRRGPVKVQLFSKLNQQGIDRAKLKAAEIIRELDAGTYRGPSKISLY